jgi:hypothetical protein
MALASAVMVFVCAALFASQETKSEERHAKRYVDSMYKAITSLEPADQRMLYRTFDASLKAAIWTAHLDNFVGMHPELSSGQRAVIAQIMPYLSASIFQAGIVTGDTPERRSLELLKTEAERLFPRDLFNAAFAQLREAKVSKPIADLPMKDNASAHEGSVLDDPPIEPVQRPDCECAMSDDRCGWGQHCGYSGCMLDTTWPSCGMFWQYNCDGMCKPNP